MIGKTFTNLSVLADSPRRHKNRPRYLCRCVCGKEFTVDHYKLTSGQTKSCGCRRTALIVAFNTTHGLTKTPEYRVWCLMRGRCLNPADHAYPLYGGRGITIAPEWDDFDVFLRDMGKKPTSKHSIDRIDVNGRYGPENCRWATWRQQQNNKRCNIRMTFSGETLTLSEWSEKLELPYSTLRNRLIRCGMDLGVVMSRKWLRPG